MRLLWLTLILWASCATGILAQRKITDDRLLRDGDLLFVVTVHENAITEVTQGVKALPIDHVAVFHRHDGQPMVIEANYKGVTETTLEEFLRQSHTVVVGRVKGKIDWDTTSARLHAQRGKPYDFIFMPDNGEVYCSELVQTSYTDRRGQMIFPPIPMSFHNENGEVTPYWKDFYSRRGLEVPEGKPGSNPGEMSRRKCVKIKYLLTSFAK